MADFDGFLDAVKDGAQDLAKEVFDGYETQTIEDANAFVQKCEKDLKRWAEHLALGDLDEDDFKDLVEGKEALAEIHALTQVGIGLAKVERFRSGLIDLVVNKGIQFFL